MFFLPKQDSFQDSCINHLRCLRKSLFPLILASFLKLNDFTIDFFAKEVALITSSSPELIFSRNSADSAFSFGSIAQNENAESAEIFRFTISSGHFCQTKRFETILILKA